MNNKKAKQMIYSIYCDLNSKYASCINYHDKYIWSFDRLRLCEMSWDRSKLRFPEISKVSLTANQLKGIE